MASKSGAGFLDSIQWLLAYSLNPTGLSWKAAIGGIDTTQAGFWTGDTNSIDRHGMYLDSSWTANTYKTLLDITSVAGFATAFVGPTLASQNDTVTWKVTIDGVSVERTITAQAATQRTLLGLALTDSAFIVGPGGALNLFSSGVSGDLTTFYAQTASYNLLPLTVQPALSLGCTVLQFANALKVEAKTSAAINATANLEQRSGVVYQRVY
ncbi:MAG: hypothetical protein HYR63_24475 [Proteobacteria bacterium]|nr:hypothetical protein [Pseudomonadota bacterium]